MQNAGAFAARGSPSFAAPKIQNPSLRSRAGARLFNESLYMGQRIKIALFKRAASDTRDLPSVRRKEGWSELNLFRHRLLYGTSRYSARDRRADGS
jgi:hypothetical protein